jgi:LemA protein
MKKGLIVTLVVIAVVVFGGCSMYKSWQNGLNASKQEVNAKWADVQNQYQRRADLIDNLVATVKGAAQHEQSTLTGVIEARAKATQITVNADDLTPEKLQQYQAAQGQLGAALGRLMAVSEAYPDLKANQNFLALQNQIEGTENRIATSRKYFNDAVLVYNTKVTNFPTSLVANSMGFKERPTFEADAAAQNAPKVKF